MDEVGGGRGEDWELMRAWESRGCVGKGGATSVPEVLVPFTELWKQDKRRPSRPQFLHILNGDRNTMAVCTAGALSK